MWNKKGLENHNIWSSEENKENEMVAIPREHSMMARYALAMLARGATGYPLAILARGATQRTAVRAEIWNDKDTLITSIASLARGVNRVTWRRCIDMETLSVFTAPCIKKKAKKVCDCSSVLPSYLSSPASEMHRTSLRLGYRRRYF